MLNLLQKVKNLEKVSLRNIMLTTEIKPAKVATKFFFKKFADKRVCRTFEFLILILSTDPRNCWFVAQFLSLFYHTKT